MAIHLSTLPRKTKRLVLRTARLTKAKLLGEAKRFYRTYVSKTAIKHTVERTATAEGANGVAIVALYPRGPLLASVTRLISTLVDEKYLVIAVVNKSRLSPEWITALAAMNITLLSRPNVGRDFGAYKVGYLFAETHGLLEQQSTCSSRMTASSMGRAHRRSSAICSKMSTRGQQCL